MASDDINGEIKNTSVLVIGAGVVGLSLAIMLAKQGIDVMVYEARTEKGTSRISPQLLLLRTMEIYQSLGIANEMRAESEKHYNVNGAILAMETLASPTPLATYSSTLNDGVDKISPAKRIFLTQHMLIRVLRRKAQSMPLITLHYECAITDLQQDENNVIATTNSGKIIAKYCVGCDGASGITRKVVAGENISGRGQLTKSLTIIFRGDLKRFAQRAYPNALVLLNNPAIRGLVRLDKSGESGMLVVYTSVRRVPPNIKDQRRAKAWFASQVVRDAVGSEEVQVELVTGEDWIARSQSADQLQNGRIFLAGEAARQMAPVGGYAGNTGIQDAYNIAWKLALVLFSQASPALLETYHTERHPTGVFTMEQAYTRWKLRCFPTQQDVPAGEDEVADLNVDIGQRYNDSTAVLYVSGAKGAIYEDPFWPTAFPGSRAPHMWIPRGNRMYSLYECFQFGKFTIFCSDRGKAWINAVETLSKRYPIKVALVPLREFFSKYKIRDTGAVLIRPDGIIGWKALNDSDVSQLGAAIQILLGLHTEERDGDMDKMLTIHRADTTPEITVSLLNLTLDEKKTEAKNSPSGLLRRMTTMKPKKPKYS